MFFYIVSPPKAKIKEEKTMFKFFNGVETLDELKKSYRKLAMMYHPDMGGDSETMKQINDEHDRLFEILKRRHNSMADENHQTTETAEEFREIIAKLIILDGLEIELCGSWLWIGGNTKENKDALKAAGCRWSKNKNKWYWHHAEEGRKWYKGHSTMADIRTKYGSQVVSKGGAEYSNYNRIGETA